MLREDTLLLNQNWKGNKPMGKGRKLRTMKSTVATEEARCSKKTSTLFLK